MSDTDKIWSVLKAFIKNDFGTAGLIGNLYAESALSPINLQNSYNKKLGLTDEQYTANVDNGSYTNFVHDSAGYGLAQWTYYSRKQSLLDFSKKKGTSIGDLEMQLDFLKSELSNNYSALVKVLTSATSVKQASDAVLTVFEKPADQSDSVKTTRANYGQKYYDTYKEMTTTVTYYLGQASHDEHGACYYNGAAGDQTGTEVAISNFYSYPWNVVLRPKTTALANAIANAMIEACNNNKIGYDMGQRNTAYVQWKTVKSIAKISVACECDCSSLVSLCITQSGVDVLTGTSNAPVTSTLKNVLVNTGKFEALTGDYCTDPSKLKRGDILLKEGSHTAVFLGTTKTAVTVAATTSTSQKPGDAINSAGIKYCSHVQSYGWLAQVHDGQVSGTTGQSKRMEALKFDVSAIEGLKLTVKLHIQNIGWKTYTDITADTILGTVGESKRIEAIEIIPEGLPDGKKLYYAVHVESIGWMSTTEGGYAAGTMGQKKAIQAIKVWIA